MGNPPSQPYGRPANPSGSRRPAMQRVTERPRPRQAPTQPAPPSQPRRLQLSALIDDRIALISTRERQRAVLINTVLLAQALMTLMVAPGYFTPTLNLPVLIALGVALLFYGMAFAFNALRRDLRVAVYLMVGGSMLAITALAILSALLTKDSAHTAQTTLLFLPVILEAGLFLTPELTLLVGSVSAVVTAIAILLAVALSGDGSVQLGEIYLRMVYALGIEVFIGYLAWRLALFIYETVKNAQADEDLRFSRARLSATEQQINDQRRQISQDIGIIQMAVSAALSHEYDTGIETVTGDLAPLASSVNLLIQQLRSTNELERKLQRMEAQSIALVESAGRLATGAPPQQQRADALTDNALYSVSVALQQAHSMLATRQANLQEIAAGIMASLKHGREGFVTMAQESTTAQQLAGRLVSLGESLVNTTQRQSELLAQARRALALVLPPELTQEDAADGSLREPLMRDGDTPGDLAGLGADLGIIQPGLTGEYDALPPSETDAADIPPMTTRLKALDERPEQAHDDERAPTVAAGELPAGLADAWLLLSHLQSQTTAQSRAATALTYDLGVLGRHIRQTSQGMDWVNQSMLTSEESAEDMLQLAGGATLDTINNGGSSQDTGGLRGGFARQAPNSSSQRGANATRPLESEQQALVNSLALDAAPAPTPNMESDPAAPGTLRISSLIDFDALSGRGGSGGLSLQPGQGNPLDGFPGGEANQRPEEQR